jgi:hypothetical protein
MLYGWPAQAQRTRHESQSSGYRFRKMKRIVSEVRGNTFAAPKAFYLTLDAISVNAKI